MNITAAWRKRIYTITAVVMAGMLAFGIVTPEQLNDSVSNAVALLGSLAAVLALVNVTPDEPPVDDGDPFGDA